mmetsp:Transcript_8157/g.18918  ORF Transcript_8157/g.18918 Transcript_8157/m.18918 type:complete len:93 (+) Transcript_8157:166-444(+)
MAPLHLIRTSADGSKRQEFVLACLTVPNARRNQQKSAIFVAERVMRVNPALKLCGRHASNNGIHEQCHQRQTAMALENNFGILKRETKMETK